MAGDANEIRLDNLFIIWLKNNPTAKIEAYIQAQGLDTQQIFEQCSAEEYADYLIYNAGLTISIVWYEGQRLSDLSPQTSRTNWKAYEQERNTLELENTAFHSEVAMSLLKKNRLDLVIELFVIVNLKGLDHQWFLEIVKEYQKTIAQPRLVTSELIPFQYFDRYASEMQSKIADCVLILVREKILTTLNPMSKKLQYVTLRSLLIDNEANDADLALQLSEPISKNFSKVMVDLVKRAELKKNELHILALLEIAYKNEYIRDNNPFDQLLFPFYPRKDMVQRFFKKLFSQFSAWFEPLIITHYVKWLNRQYTENEHRVDMGYIRELLVAWPESGTILFTKIFRNLLASENRSNLKVLMSWEGRLKADFGGEIPEEVYRLFWEMISAADHERLDFNNNEPCSELQFYLISQHADKVSPEYITDLHPKIIQHLRKMAVLARTSSLRLLDCQTVLKSLPIQYSYFLIAELSNAHLVTAGSWLNELNLENRPGFEQSKPYQIKLCQTKIEKNLQLLTEGVDRLSDDARLDWAEACAAFQAEYQRYKNGEVLHTDLLNEFNRIINSQTIKPILQTHSNLGQLLLDIAINICIIASLVGLVALTAYRCYQGFQYGFFVHTETKRQRLAQELECSVAELPEGRAHDFSAP